MVNDMSATPCKVDGCDKTVKARGWCNEHYGRWYRYGDPLESRPYKGRPRIREGLPHLFLDPPSLTNYGRGCKCDGCRDAKCVQNAESRAKIAAENEEMWAHVNQIRERMGIAA